MAGFGSLGSNNFGNISGQQAPSGYGIQPPTSSYAPSMGALGGGMARSAPSNPANFYQQSASMGFGPDTSGQHQENVAMAQAGFGNLGMTGFRGTNNNGTYSGGYGGETPGTSYSNYGLSAPGYSDINAYMMNPLGGWQPPAGMDLSSYGGANAPNNSNRYQMMMDTIKSSLTNQWSPQAQGMANQYGAVLPNSSFAAPQGYNSDQLSKMAADMLQAFGGAYGTLPPPSAQMLNIPNPNIAGMRAF